MHTNRMKELGVLLTKLYETYAKERIFERQYDRLMTEYKMSMGDKNE